MNAKKLRAKRLADDKRDRAHARLVQLYEISKRLVSFETVEQSFPKIISLITATLPLSSAVLIEKRSNILKTTIWPTVGLTEAQIKNAVTNARNAYSYLAGSTLSQIAGLKSAETITAPLRGEEFIEPGKKPALPKFLVLPIVLDLGEVFGVLQFETTNPLNEEDLAFVDALTNLISVSLDRYYWSEDKQRLQQTETASRSSELKKQQEEIINLEEEKLLREKFVSVLTHDLRTPLTSVKLSAQLILRKPGSVENCYMMATRIINSINRLDKMIGDLLDANRIRAGEQLRLEMSYCNLSTHTHDTIEFLKSIHGDRFQLDEVQPEVWGYWNQDALRRVIENLVNNAVKYGSPHYPVSITLRQSKKNIQLVVHNEGNPIAKAEQAGLFQQFRRTDSAETSKKKGWGLGLTLVKGMVEIHGGKISIESSPAQGTAFTVEIPNDSRPFQDTALASVSA